MQFKGKTEDADSVFLGAEFWKPGTHVSGKVARTFESENGPCYAMQLVTPVTIDSETVDEVCIGNLTGFRMAIQAAGAERLQVGDLVYLECTGSKITSRGSPRPNFEIEINRP